MNRFNGEIPSGINYAPNADDGAEEVVDKKEIVFSPEDQKELDKIEQEAGQLYGELIDFAEKVGIDTKEFSIEDDNKMIEMAKKFQELCAERKANREKNQEKEKTISFLTSDVSIETVDDLYANVRSDFIALEHLTSDNNYCKNNMWFIHDAIDRGRSDSDEQLIQIAHYNGANVPGDSNGSKYFFGDNERTLASSYPLLTQRKEDTMAISYRLLILQSEIAELLEKTNVIESETGFSQNNDRRGKTDFQKIYLDNITKENTFEFAPMIELASRTFARLFSKLIILMSKRQSYLGNLAEQGTDKRFNLLDIESLRTDPENVEKYKEEQGKLQRIFAIGGYTGYENELSRKIYVLPSTFEFTQEDIEKSKQVDLLAEGKES